MIVSYMPRRPMKFGESVIPFWNNAAIRALLLMLRGPNPRYNRCTGSLAPLVLMRSIVLGIFPMRRTVMTLPDIRLMQAAIVLAEELNFSRAADRLHIAQSTLSKQVLELENQLGFRLFERDHQTVELTDAGRKFVEEARESVLHAERAVLVAASSHRGADEILNIGKSAYTDPYLVSIFLSIRLPLYPGMHIRWWSNHSSELACDVVAGTLDLALATGVPDTPKLSCLKLAEHPFYVAMSAHYPLAAQREVRLADMHNRTWILFSRHVSPYLYDAIVNKSSKAYSTATEMHHVTGAEESVPLIHEHDGLAILTRTGAWRIARDGITMRPLVEDNLRVVTNLAARGDSKSRLVSEFVKATARKLEGLRKPSQARLPLSA